MKDEKVMNNRSRYVLSGCSTADIDAAEFAEIGVEYICFHYQLNDEWYADDLGKSMSFDEFYRRMEEGEMTKTSQVNAEEYMEYFEKFLAEGKDIIHVCLSSGISGTFNSANIARDELLEKYPDRRIAVIDSMNASAGFGLLLAEASEKRDEGMDFDELVNWIEAEKMNYHAWFFSTTLKYFVRGGRITPTAGFVGNMLHICPLMLVDHEGKLLPRYKIRGKKKVIQAMVDKMEELVENGRAYTGQCFISHSACLEDAQAVAALINERFPGIKGGVKIFNIGTTIGAHTGPGTVALFFRGVERTEDLVK